MAIQAVAVINSPSDPAHVTHLLKDSTEEITKNGKANVNVGGIEFTIKKQFLDDLQNKSLDDIVRNFRKALLILHSSVWLRLVLVNEFVYSVDTLEHR